MGSTLAIQSHVQLDRQLSRFQPVIMGGAAKPGRLARAWADWRARVEQQRLEAEVLREARNDWRVMRDLQVIRDLSEWK